MLQLSEKAEAIHALQTEINSLRVQSKEIYIQQIDLYQEYQQKMTRLSDSQTGLINRVIALEEMIAKIIEGGK